MILIGIAFNISCLHFFIISIFQSNNQSNHISLLKFWPQDIVFLKENLAESQLQLREFSKVYSRLMGQIIITLEMEHQELKKERHHQLKQLSKTDTVTIGEKLKKENNKLNRAVPCVPDTISKVKIELDLNATINTK